MKKVLKADFFDLCKSKMIRILPIGAVLLGFLMPLMYYGIKVMFEYLATLEPLKNNSSMSMMNGLLNQTLNARTVFISSLPLSQGFGLMLTAMVGFRVARPFTTGVYRNKVIVGIDRTAIYLSQSLICLLLSIGGALIYTLAAAGMSSLTFGPLELSGKEVLGIAVLSFGIYLVYTAIPVFIAFTTRSTPLTLIVSMVLPILMQTAISLISPAMLNAPDVLIYALAVLPSFQGVMMSSADGTVLLIAIASDLLIAALLTLFGILRFRKADMK